MLQLQPIYNNVTKQPVRQCTQQSAAHSAPPGQVKLAVCITCRMLQQLATLATLATLVDLACCTTAAGCCCRGGSAAVQDFLALSIQGLQPCRCSVPLPLHSCGRHCTPVLHIDQHLGIPMWPACGYCDNSGDCPMPSQAPHKNKSASLSHFIRCTAGIPCTAQIVG